MSGSEVEDARIEMIVAFNVYKECLIGAREKFWVDYVYARERYMQLASIFHSSPYTPRNTYQYEKSALI